MRAQSDPWFLDYLLRIGNGTEDMFVGDYVRLPKDIVIEYKDEHSIDRLIDCVFPSLDRNACSTQYMCERGILFTRNDYVDEINVRMIDRFPGKAMVFYSFDSWMMTNVIIILKTFSIPSHLMVCHRTSSESRSIIPLFSSVI
jgi:ATP-dependent DNA helicase PIF1